MFSLSVLFTTEILLCIRNKNHRNFVLLKLLDVSLFIKKNINKFKIWYIDYFNLKDSTDLKYVKDGKLLIKPGENLDENTLILKTINNIEINENVYENYAFIYDNKTANDFDEIEIIKNMENYKCDYTFLLLSVKLDNDVKYILDFKNPYNYLMINNIINNNFLNYYLNLTHNVNLTNKYVINIMTNKMQTYNLDETQYIILKKDEICINKY